jgi:hypothetical protein
MRISLGMSPFRLDEFCTISESSGLPGAPIALPTASE